MVVVTVVEVAAAKLTVCHKLLQNVFDLGSQS